VVDGLSIEGLKPMAQDGEWEWEWGIKDIKVVLSRGKRGVGGGVTITQD
jgi:hypothetical protein